MDCTVYIVSAEPIINEWTFVSNKVRKYVSPTRECVYVFSTYVRLSLLDLCTTYNEPHRTQLTILDHTFQQTVRQARQQWIQYNPLKCNDATDKHDPTIRSIATVQLRTTTTYVRTYVPTVHIIHVCIPTYIHVCILYVRIEVYV